MKPELPGGLFGRKTEQGLFADSTNQEHFDVSILQSDFRVGAMLIDGRLALSRVGTKTPEGLLRQHARRIAGINQCNHVVLMLKREAPLTVIPEYDKRLYFGIVVDVETTNIIEVFGQIPPDLIQRFKSDVFPALTRWAQENIDCVRARAKQGASDFARDLCEELESRYSQAKGAFS